jgi:lipopolysaccharide/colanic/teichoic acid biosynthesis glycosyltransferase
MALNRSQEGLSSVHRALRVEVFSDRAASSYLGSPSKRSLDLFISSIGVLAFLLILPFVALVIKLSSPGPVLYRQKRTGLHGKPFHVIKFRTMRTDAEADGNPVWASADDPRLTGVGSLLRRLYIDEFPQWWNVWRGEMSVVGPRPERPELASRILEHVPEFNQRLLAKPGITGLAQVNYKYTNSVAEARNKLRLDLVYINAASLWVDLKLVVRTVRRVFTFKGT